MRFTYCLTSRGLGDSPAFATLCVCMRYAM